MLELSGGFEVQKLSHGGLKICQVNRDSSRVFVINEQYAHILYLRIFYFNHFKDVYLGEGHRIWFQDSLQTAQQPSRVLPCTLNHWVSEQSINP